MEWYWWLAISLAGGTVIGIVVWVLVDIVFKKYLKDITFNGHDVHKEGTAVTKFTNGQTINLAVSAKGVDDIDWSLSTDGGVTYTSIASGVSGNSTVWVIPGSVYSRRCFIKATSGDLSTVSEKFTVEPTFSIRTGEKLVENHIVPNRLTIHYQTDSTLITADNLVLTTSTDGVNYSAPSAQDTYEVFPTEKYVIWNVNTDLAGQSLKIKLATNNLVATGHPTELEVQSINKLRFVSSHEGTATSTGSKFTTFLAYGDSGSTVPIVNNYGSGTSWLTYGEKIYFVFTVDGDALQPSDLTFSYSTGTNIDSWTDFDSVTAVSVSGNQYSVTLPSLVGSNNTINFRVQQSSSIDPKPESIISSVKISGYIHIAQGPGGFYLSSRVLKSNTQSPPQLHDITAKISSIEVESADNPFITWTAKYRMWTTGQEVDADTGTVTYNNGYVVLSNPPRGVESFVLTYTYTPAGSSSSRSISSVRVADANVMPSE